jgi:hypothetical protein
VSEPAGVELPMTHRRQLGVMLLVVFALALAAAHLWRWRARGANDLGQAYVALAAAVERPAEVSVHARRAQELLGQAAGGVVLDAEALVALHVAEQLPAGVGQTPPLAPSVDTALSAEAAAAHVEALLSRGMTVQALTFLRRPEVGRHESQQLRILRRVAERWQAARTPSR